MAACGGNSGTPAGTAGGEGGSGGGGGSGGSGGSPPPVYPSNRTQFVRTDDTPNSAVYDSVHKFVFASEPSLGIVDAISVADQQIKAKIFVPGVNALAITPDNTKVLATTSAQVAWIDTSLLRIVEWQILPKVNDPKFGEEYFAPSNYFAPPCAQPSYPFAAYNAAILANGKVLFEAQSLFPLIAEWDPIANATTWLSGFDTIGSGPSGGPMATSSNGTEVIFAAGPNITSGPTIFDSSTGQYRTSTAFGYVALVAANPTGTQFALLTGGTITFIDAQFNILAQLPGSANGMVYSTDGKYLYIATGGSVPGLSTIDAQTYKVVGSAPDYYDSCGSETPIAADDKGLVFGSATGGLVFSDVTNYQTFSSNPLSPPLNDRISTTEGPTNGGTLTTVSTGLPGKLPDVWFGTQLATSESLTGSGVQATTPPSLGVGTVNVKIVEPDGTMDVIPQAFTYGVVPLNPAPLAAAPTGGAQADVIGFGFGADISGTAPQVTIGGANARVVSHTQAGGIPRQDLAVSIPPGSPGAVDIVVTSPSGMGTLARGFHYLNGVTDYPTTDSLKSAFYDHQRQQLYLNASDHIDVFSLNQKAYTTSIVPPSLGGTRQLTGMAMTPDSSKLLVGNYPDDSVAIINPDNPGSSTAVRIFPPPNPGTSQAGPYMLAATSKGTVFVSGNGLYELDLATLQAAQAVEPGLANSGDLLSGSRDGTHVYVATSNLSWGYVNAWSAATDTWMSHGLGAGIELFYVDGVASADGNVFAMSMDLSVSQVPYPMIVDSQLNLISQLGIEPIFAAANLQGNALHDSGALLYSSTNYGIDIIDVKHGALAERILLNEQDAFLNGSLAVDETGQSIFLLTNAGLTIIDLDSVPVSIGSVTPATGGAGTLIKIRGSGYGTGTTVTFNGTAADTTLVDADTLEVSVPTIPSGAAQITISNPNGNSYSLDAAFQVQ